MGSDILKIRKYRDDLNVCGLSVIVLGVWGVIKAIIQVFLELKTNPSIKAETHMTKIVIIILIVLIIGSLASLIMWLHLYVGLNAMKAARSQPHKKKYYPACIFLCALTVSSLGLYIGDFKDLSKIDITLAALLVDITTIYIYVVLIISTVKIRKLTAGQTADSGCSGYRC